MITKNFDLNAAIQAEISKLEEEWMSIRSTKQIKMISDPGFYNNGSNAAYQRQLDGIEAEYKFLGNVL